MKLRHFNIPIFIPNAACPFNCIFCNQKNISGFKEPPGEQDIINIIESHLSTIPPKCHVEIAFFGGNFTGIPIDDQERYLSVVFPYLDKGKVHGIRLSTRPDYINEEGLSLLKRFNVKTIELGVQSMDDEVLISSGRGHTAKEVASSSAMIKESGFNLGLQMMIGLPGDTLEKSINTANDIIKLGAKITRIYPTLVIKDTELEEMYITGKYDPLSLQEAVKWSAILLQQFENSGVNVIRIGLHPGKELISGESLIAGPFHVSFRELVLTKIWRNILELQIQPGSYKKIDIYISPDEINYAIGHKGGNKKMLLDRYTRVNFKKDSSLRKREIHVDYN